MYAVIRIRIALGAQRLVRSVRRLPSGPVPSVPAPDPRHPYAHAQAHRRAGGLCGWPSSIRIRSTSSAAVPLQVECVDVDTDGLCGICIDESTTRRRAIFVPGALPGAIVRVVIEEEGVEDGGGSKRRKKSKGLTYGRIVDVVKEHDGKVDAVCPHFGSCGGCSLQEVAYAQQREIKARRVRNAFERIAGLAAGHPALAGLRITGSPEPYRYRNRVEFSVVGSSGNVVVGKHRRGSKEVVAVGGCALQRSAADACYASVVESIDRGGLSGGVVVEYVSIRESVYSGEILVNVATRERADVDLVGLAEHVRYRHPALRGVVNSVLEQGSPVELRRVREEHVVWGAGDLVERLGDVTYRVSANAFFQVNTALTELLYWHVVDACRLRPSDVVLDLYCGSGTIALFLAQHSAVPPARILGIEVVEGSIADARYNAEANGVTCATFVRGDVGDVRKIAEAHGVAGPDVIVVDPARAGLSTRALDGVVSLGPRRLVYVSCDVSTQARDVKRVLESGMYRVEDVAAFDMYPQTTHVESVCTMTRIEE